uniref:Ig-like domain-containing protein n=1 Tax=Podarcis muralis TaxID=64176 RepID=A0A670ITY3_PODMU
MGRHEAWRPPGWRCSWHTAFLAASVLSSCFLLTRAQETTGISIRVVPEVLKEGDSVTLTPEGLDLKNIASCKWYRGAVEERNMIISFFRPPFSGETKGPAHTGRETVKPDFSLYITDLKPADSGIYSFKPEGPGVTITGATNITVSETLSNPVLWPAEAIVAENASVSLQCNTSNRLDVNVTWFKDSNPVLDKAVLFNRNRNLTLTAVSKDEEGMYTCKATNPVSKATSNPSKISLAYGPNNVKLNQTGTVTLKLGSRLALLCTAESLPEAQFRWFFNHTNMNVTANTFSTDLTAWEDGGNYTCQAYNSVVKKLASASVNVKLTTQESTPPGSGLTPGQIVGIVIGCVLGVALIGGLGYFLFTKTALGVKRTYNIQH